MLGRRTVLTSSSSSSTYACLAGCRSAMVATAAGQARPFLVAFEGLREAALELPMLQR